MSQLLAINKDLRDKYEPDSDLKMDEKQLEECLKNDDDKRKQVEQFIERNYPSGKKMHWEQKQVAQTIDQNREDQKLN